MAGIALVRVDAVLMSTSAAVAADADVLDDTAKLTRRVFLVLTEAKVDPFKFGGAPWVLGVGSVG
jgi:hypothetical protein